VLSIRIEESSPWLVVIHVGAEPFRASLVNPCQFVEIEIEEHEPLKRLHYLARTPRGPQATAEGK
jgi:hypothetical protein